MFAFQVCFFCRCNSYLRDKKNAELRIPLIWMIKEKIQWKFRFEYSFEMFIEEKNEKSGEKVEKFSFLEFFKNRLLEWIPKQLPFDLIW